MKVKIKARSITSGSVTYSEECNSVDDIVAITKALVTSSEAYVNDLPFVKNGQVEMYVYNFKEEVLLHLQGNPEELDAKRNPNIQSD